MKNHIPEKPYDVFLSYSREDQATVEELASRLEKEGVRPFFDKWSLVPGEPWQEALERALEQSTACAVLLGVKGIGPWQNEEMRSAIEERVRNPSWRVIPVLLPGATRSLVDPLPRFLRRLTWVVFGASLDDAEALGRLLAGIRGFAPGALHSARIGKVIPPALEQGIVHALPPAPAFVGRRRELAELGKFWSQEENCVIALIGLGGAGKTALATHFLTSLLDRCPCELDAIFVWSFYVDQHVPTFLQVAYKHFSGGQETSAAGAGLLYRFTEILAQAGKCLLVLDGLERVQRPRSDLHGAFGELEDPLLRQVVSRFALGIGRAKCLVTSRFPLSDLHPWENRSFRSLDIDQLDREDAYLLLRRHRVEGPDSMLDNIIRGFGSHALTLDHVGVYLSEFCEGDAAGIEKLEEPRTDSDLSQERKLARILSAYERVLAEHELDLLSRLCIFRFGVSIGALHQLFSTPSSDRRISGSLAGLSAMEFQRIIARLVRLHLILPESHESYTAHPAIRDHFYRVFADVRTIHGVAESAFRSLALVDLLDEWSYIHKESSEKGNVTSKTVKRITSFVAKHSSRLSAEALAAINSYKYSVREGKTVELPVLTSQSSMLVLGGSALYGRPGIACPTDTASLNFLEELIYHSLHAGAHDNAYSIYNGRMGGREHIGKIVGDFSRGLRIMKSFQVCPNELDLAWYMRGVGDLKGSLSLLRRIRPIWAGTVMCLQGFLREVVADKSVWPQSRMIAEFLSGVTKGRLERANFGWGEAFIGAELLLLKEDLDGARLAAMKGLGDAYIPDRVRAKLVLGNIECRLGNKEAAEKIAHETEDWILRSSSVEHLCQLHLFRARLNRLGERWESAGACLREGLHLATRNGFGLHAIDILNEEARLYLDWGRLKKAESPMEADRLFSKSKKAAECALTGVLVEGDIAPMVELDLKYLLAMGARHPDCRYIWGEVEALRLLGEVSVERKCLGEARQFLIEAVSIQESVQHARLPGTKEVLQTLQ